MSHHPGGRPDRQLPGPPIRGLDLDPVGRRRPGFGAVGPGILWLNGLGLVDFVRLFFRLRLGLGLEFFGNLVRLFGVRLFGFLRQGCSFGFGRFRRGLRLCRFFGGAFFGGRSRSTRRSWRQPTR